MHQQGIVYLVLFNSFFSFSAAHADLATQKRLKNMTKFLMSQGADPSVGNNDAETPLHMAVFIGDPEIFALFFSNLGPEASTSLRDTRGNTPLHYAASFNQLDILAILVQAGGDLQAKNKEGCTVFLQSVTAGRKEVAASLMQLNPSSVQDTDAQGGNALHMTCKSGSIEMMAPMVMWLLSVGVNVHARDTHNCLPLHYAASSGSVTCTRILLWKMLETLAYAQPSASDTLQNTNQGDSVNNSTPPVSNVGAGVMSFASVCGLSPDVDIASLAGGQKEVACLLGTPLFFAAHHRRTEVVDLLLNGVPRPCHVAPLHELAVPQAGWICDASGTGYPASPRPLFFLSICIFFSF
jgi:ankyrin repeat protein